MLAKSSSCCELPTSPPGSARRASRALSSRRSRRRGARPAAPACSPRGRRARAARTTRSGYFNTKTRRVPACSRRVTGARHRDTTPRYVSAVAGSVIRLRLAAHVVVARRAVGNGEVWCSMEGKERGRDTCSIVWTKRHVQLTGRKTAQKDAEFHPRSSRPSCGAARARALRGRAGTS